VWRKQVGFLIVWAPCSHLFTNNNLATRHGIYWSLKSGHPFPHNNEMIFKYIQDAWLLIFISLNTRWIHVDASGPNHILFFILQGRPFRLRQLNRSRVASMHYDNTCVIWWRVCFRMYCPLFPAPLYPWFAPFLGPGFWICQRIMKRLSHPIVVDLIR